MWSERWEDADIWLWQAGEISDGPWEDVPPGMSNWYAWTYAGVIAVIKRSLPFHTISKVSRVIHISAVMVMSQQFHIEGFAGKSG